MSAGSSGLREGQGTPDRTAAPDAGAGRVLCRADDVPEGRFLPVMLGRAKVLVTRLPDGSVRAIAARCPHQGADLAHGCVVAYVDADGQGGLTVDPARAVVRCPWHGFEYFADTGEAAVASPAHHRLRLRTYPVAIEDGHVVVTG